MKSMVLVLLRIWELGVIQLEKAYNTMFSKKFSGLKPNNIKDTHSTNV